MENTQFMGLLIGCLSTILGIASVLCTIIIKPIINLNKSITKLNDNIDRLNRDNDLLGARLTKHGIEIDACSKHLIVHDKEIEYLKEKVKK